MYYWHVWLVDHKGKKVKHIDTVRAMYKENAEDKCFLHYGSASKYTGWRRENFLAEKA